MSVAGGPTGYRVRTLAIIRRLLDPLGPIASAVDVGAGDGWIADSLMQEGWVARCTPVDVVRRDRVMIEPVLYDGRTLPFADRSMTLAYAVDAAHHAADPPRFLAELARVSSRWVLLKDHTQTGSVGKFLLRLLDEIGNRRFGIGSPGNYQRSFQWLDLLAAKGFAVRSVIHPAPCHAGVLGIATNHLQFVALLERSRSAG